MFWCSGSGLTFDYPWKLIPWYEKPRGGASVWMIDSGVKATPPTIDELVEAQVQHADIAVNPDILGDFEATMDRTAEWLPKIREQLPQAPLVLCTHGSIDQRLWAAELFPECRFVGLGLCLKRPEVPWSNEEREEILRAVVPVVHRMGRRVHVFGIGCTRKHLELFRELRVDSFDSSAPLLAAANGRVFNDDLKQIRIGGSNSADAKRLRAYINLGQIRRAIEEGFPS